MAIQIRRREFIVTLGGAVATCPLVARAQQTVRVLRLGFVGGQPRDAAIYVAFQKRMAELGYRDRYFTFEYIQTPSIDAYDATFRELVARKPDVVMAAGNELRAWPDPAATSLESSSTRSNWRRNASSWYASPSRKRATLGSSGTPRPAIRLRPRQWQPNPSTSNRGALR